MMHRGIQHDLSAQVRTHLFVMCPNNSGSTLLRNVLTASRHTWWLAREGQHAFGFVGPRLRDQRRNLIWAARAAWADEYRDPANFDWEATRLAWYAQAVANDAAASVFLEKSPPFILVSDQLRAALPGARFIFMVRNPYAMYEGIIRRRLANPPDDAEDPRRLAAWHVVRCLATQRDNLRAHADVSVAFSYEQLCTDPAACAVRIRALVPVLDDLDLTRQVAVKGIYDEPLRDMNAQQIARLTPDELAIANEVFSGHADLLAHFGYSLLMPGQS